MSPDHKQSDNKNETVAVTGGTGFLGRHIIQQVLAAGYSVRTLQHKTPVDISHPELTIIRGGLGDAHVLKKLVQGADSVVHAAALVKARHRNEFSDVNVDGTSNLFNISKNNEIKRFLYVSSLAAREPHLSPYALSKYQAENLFSEANKTIAWDIIRPPAIYGPGDEEFLPLFSAIKKGWAPLPAGREARVSLIHVEDAAAAVVTWVKSGQATWTMYEIDDGHDGGHRWPDVLDLCGEVMGKAPRHFVPPTRLLLAYAGLSSLVARMVGRASFVTPGKIRELCHPDWVSRTGEFNKTFSWSPRWSLEDGVKQTLTAYIETGLL